MSIPDEELFAIVWQEIVKVLSFAEDQNQRVPDDMLHPLLRLANSDSARMAWKQMAALQQSQQLESGADPKEQQKRRFKDVASAIVRETAYCNESFPTASDARQIGKRAARLAAELVHLIESNNYLFMGMELVPEFERAAVERITRGVTFSGCGSDGFSAEVERELDRLQERDFPSCKAMTTANAYAVLAHGDPDEQFVSRLRAFAELVENNCATAPLDPRPNHPHAKEQRLALSVMRSLNYHYGKPKISITAGIVSGVFETDLSDETIKKWWQRRRDNSLDSEGDSVPDNEPLA